MGKTGVVFGLALAIGTIALSGGSAPEAHGAQACNCGAIKVESSELPCNTCCDSAQRLGQMIVAYAQCGKENQLPAIYSNYLKKYNIGGVEPRYCQNNAELLRFNPPLIMASNGYGRHGEEPKVMGKEINQERFYTNPFDVRVRTGNSFPVDSSCHELIGFASCQHAREQGFNTLLGPSVEIGTDWSDERVEDWLRFDIANIKGHRAAGCQNTVKHYPFITNAFTMHKQLTWNNKPLHEVERAERGFANAIQNEKPTFVMTSHIMDEHVDRQNPATFSTTWVNRLKNLSRGQRHQPLIMSDGMFMVSNYSLRHYYPHLLGETDARAEGILSQADIDRLESCHPKGELSSSQPGIDRVQLNKLLFGTPAHEKSKGDPDLKEVFGPHMKKEKLSETEYTKIAGIMGTGDGESPADDFSKAYIDQLHCLNRMLHSDPALVKRLRKTNERFMAIVTERAIMAGHDLVIMEGSPQDGARTMDQMIGRACGSGKASADFRSRIHESSERIAAMKASPDFQRSTRRPGLEALPKDVAKAVVELIEDVNSFLGTEDGKKLAKLAQTNSECKQMLHSKFNCMTRYPDLMSRVGQLAQ